MKQLGERLTRRALKRLVHLPGPAYRVVFGQPPANDRGVRLDEQTHALIKVLDATYRPSLEELGPEKARDAYALSSRIFDVAPSELLSVTHEFAGGPAGPVPIRMYRPVVDNDAPAIVYLHGGGFVVGDLDDYDGFCSRLSDKSGAVVFSVDYRLAPEHPFPAAIEDCDAAFDWVYRQAHRLGVDRERIAIAGDSAGGNLATVVCQQRLRRGDAMPSHQWLIYPTTDNRGGYESMELFSDGYYLDSSLVDWFSRTYLQDFDDDADPRVSPITFDALAELPPAYIVTAGFDPLRDKGEHYAQVLRDHGVAVEHRSFDRLAHGFVTMGGVLESANRAVVDMTLGFRGFMHQN